MNLNFSFKDKKNMFQKHKNLLHGTLILALNMLLFITAFGQTKVTKIKGQVIDKVTREKLPFVNIAYKGTAIGTSTDLEGIYELETKFATDSLEISFIGYDAQMIAVQKGVKQEINVQLESLTLDLTAVVITGKKNKYKKKNNPAVDFMRKVMANKNKNRIEDRDFYQYEKYEKIQLDLNNLTDEYREKKIFKNFQFIFNYVDTSEVNGKPYLPFFIKETLSRVYYKKNGNVKKEYRDGIKLSGVSEYLEDESISGILDFLYRDINIYENNIQLLDNLFISPLSKVALDFYRFYIIDTIEYHGKQVMDMAFYPKNDQSMGFTGNLYISMDSAYSILRTDMTITRNSTINFVRDLSIIQEYEKVDNEWVVMKDVTVVDFSIGKNATGMFGSRSNEFRKYKFDEAAPDGTYSGPTEVIEDPDAYEKGIDFWQERRFTQLTNKEAGIYQMVDTLQTIPAFKRALSLISLVFAGYYTFGKVDVGPVSAIVSFNEVEGFRPRFGGETNLNFSKTVKLQGFLAYGTKDKRLKYSVGALYSLKKNFRKNPKNYFAVSVKRETTFPGQDLQFINEDNVLLSIKRGVSDQMFLNDDIKLEYFRETYQDFTYNLVFQRTKTEAIGNWKFEIDKNDSKRTVKDITTTELGVFLQYAPNQDFFQGRVYRVALYNKYPVLGLDYRAGVKDFLGGEYNYHKLKFSLNKRFNMSVLGFSNVRFEAGKVFGKIPFPLLFLPNANQTYAYQRLAYNMMNFLEFVNDEYTSISVQHYFFGYFFNRIPLFKKLKWREVVSAKVLWGRLTDGNNPDKNDDLFLLPTRQGPDIDPSDVEQSTFNLDGKAYVEASVGITNIFKVLRVDLVKRFTHLDNPNVVNIFGVKGLGLRVRARIEF